MRNTLPSALRWVEVRERAGRRLRRVRPEKLGRKFCPFENGVRAGSFCGGQVGQEDKGPILQRCGKDGGLFPSLVNRGGAFFHGVVRGPFEGGQWRGRTSLFSLQSVALDSCGFPRDGGRRDGGFNRECIFHQFLDFARHRNHCRLGRRERKRKSISSSSFSFLSGS